MCLSRRLRLDCEDGLGRNPVSYCSQVLILSLHISCGSMLLSPMSWTVLDEPLIDVSVMSCSYCQQRHLQSVQTVDLYEACHYTLTRLYTGQKIVAVNAAWIMVSPSQ